MRFKIPWMLGKGNLPANFQQFFFIQIELGKGKPNTNTVSAWEEGFSPRVSSSYEQRESGGTGSENALLRFCCFSH